MGGAPPGGGSVAGPTHRIDGGYTDEDRGDSGDASPAARGSHGAVPAGPSGHRPGSRRSPSSWLTRPTARQVIGQVMLVQPHVLPRVVVVPSLLALLLLLPRIGRLRASPGEPGRALRGFRRSGTGSPPLRSLTRQMG